MRRLICSLVAAAVVLVTGCVAVDTREYPEYWPALEARESGCPRLSGLFDNHPAGEAERGLLAKWLLPSGGSLNQVHRVELSGPDAGVLSFRLLDADGAELIRRELREEADYQCSDGWLERRQPEITMLGVVQRHVARFTRTLRGDLVVQETDVGGGVVIFMPMYASYRYWFLYRERTP